MLNLRNYSFDELIAMDDLLQNMTEMKEDSTSSFSCSEMMAMQIVIQREIQRRYRIGRRKENSQE